MNSLSKVVAIDGPSGSGKSTIAKQLAQMLGYLYIDTGAMYRALGFAAEQAGIPFENSDQMRDFLLSIDFKYGVNEQTLVEINGENLTQKIREHHVSQLASDISKLPCVRTHLLELQRELGRESFSVMEGRDIGTVVFPDAFIKIFLTASLEERAMRRLKQLEYKGEKHTLEEILEDVKRRDHNDMNRDVAPLKQAHDATYFDTTESGKQEVLDKLSQMVKQKVTQLGLS
jgi:cytidylate kinase